MNLHLFIPSLFWSDRTCPEIYHELPTPSLEVLLSKSKASISPASDLNAWLCQTFNIKKQLDWPVAPIMLHSDCLDQTVATNKDYWVRADPVHLRIEQNHIMLADHHVFDLSKEEAAQFANEINRYLTDDGISLIPLHPYRWYLRLANTPEIHTQTLSSVTGKNINYLLPTGKDSMTWHRIFNEIQMLLFEHPLNQARSARNQITVNSIWFWGGGHMPQDIHSAYSHIWSDEKLSHALADISNTTHSNLPENIENWIKTSASENQLVILDHLLSKDKYNNAYGWRENLKELEKVWFTPLYTALKNNQIKELRISTTNENAAYDFVITRNNLWKFWATIKPLSYYAVNQK